MTNLQEFKDSITQKLYKISAREAIARGICIQCHERALPNCYSDAGRREFKISGLCEKCFDEMFQE